MADEDIWVAVLGLAGEDIWRMKIFGWQFWVGWVGVGCLAGEDILVVVLRLAGEDILRMRIFGWQFQGWRVRIFGG